MNLFQNKKKWNSFKMFLYVLPFIVLVLIFAYYPLYGWVYAFFDYKPPKPFSIHDFVGLKWFKSLVENPIKINQLLQVLKNTFAMSGITLATSWLPMIFAVFMNELRCVPFRKFVQTVTTLPNFISWVLVYSVAYSLFNSTGMANTLLQTLGITTEPILFLQSSEHVWLTMWLWLTWKNLGWSAIMYIAAISGIDDEMYQAAKVDGADGIRSFIHITLPLIMRNVLTLCIPFTLWRLTGFDLVYSMTSGGPGEDTSLIAYRITMEAFTNLNVGYAAALAVMLFLVMAVFSWFNLRVMSQFEN